MKASVMATAMLCIAASVGMAQKPSYKRDVPDSLARKAKISEDSAVSIARKRLPKATISALEIEREDGKLIWSVEMKTTGKAGIDEVNVDAMTGKVIGISHESGT